MPKIKLHTKTFEHFATLTASIGTNCPQGGDSGHGGRTVFRLLCEGGDMNVRTDLSPELQHVESIEIVFGGDAECAIFAEALEFALTTLHKVWRNQETSSEEEFE
jgi:hypothetical protein